MSTPSKQPNFLFLFPDQWRWDWLACAGYDIPVKTPNIDKLASRGMRFTQCRTNSPVCAPARAALATAMRYQNCGVPGNGFNLDTSRDTFFKHLRHVGYRVAASGKTDLQKHGKWKGLDGWTTAMGQLGFTQAVNQAGKHDAVNAGTQHPVDPYMNHLHQHGLAQTHADDYTRRKQIRNDGRQGTDMMIDPTPSPFDSEHHTDDFCGRAAQRFLQDWAVGEPWHLWVNFPGPHEPYDPTVAQLAVYDGVDFPLPVKPGPVDNDHQAVRRAYAAMITGIDDWVGKLVAEIQRRGEMDNTYIIFTSDHGEMLGDHGRWDKAIAYEPSVHVPLVVAGPGIEAATQCDALVELIDLAATITDLAKLQVPEKWEARSLRKQLLEDPKAAHRDVQISALKDWKLIFDGQYKLVVTENQPDQLYDLIADENECNDLAAQMPDVVERLKARLEKEYA
ncbi:MAG: sulfatase [Phycisphaeraceae bacterium JB051]